MTLSYRARKRLRTLGIVALVLFLVFSVVYLCWVLFVDRYVIFTDEGAKLDFSASVDDLSGGIIATEPAPEEPVSIYYNEGQDVLETEDNLKPLSGYYADSDALAGSLDDILSAVNNMSKDCAVMLDMKSIYGNYYYSTGIEDASLSETVSIDAVGQLISALHDKEAYTIARVPAFRDRDYVVKNPSCAIPGKDAEGNASYPWPADDSCYWMDPANDQTVTMMIRIAHELQDLGFDEVVFSDFYIPYNDELYFDSELSRNEILEQVAADLISSCGAPTFAISFETIDPALVIPEGRSRLYLAGVDAAEVDDTVQKITVTDPMVNLVFLADTNDTRFDAYSVLRPIANAK